MPDDLRDLMKRRAAQKADAGLQRMRSLTARMETVDGAVTHAIPLDWIVADATIQVRVDGLDMDRVAMYAEQLRQGAEFPPVDLFREGDTYYLGDGFHRYAAHQEAGAESILAIIHPGGLDAAFEHAEAANLDHGLSLTNDDKKNILFRRLDRGVWNQDTSQREIGRLFGVAHTTIGRWLDEYAGVVQKSSGANAPLAEEHAKAKKASRPRKGTREANKKRGPTELQLRQRAVRDLRAAADALRQLGIAGAADVDLYADELAAEWGL
jgi:transposase